VYKAAIDADAKIGNDAGISGTPAFVITPAGSAQGYYVSGAQPFTKFRKLIDKALSEAK
jgi:predicted DsbA family dithiol-disulfide isomerase